MIIKCEHCGVRHTINGAALGRGGLTITCTACGRRSRYGGTTHEGDAAIKPATSAAKAWLIVHDEQTHMQIFEIKEGQQLVGRKSDVRPCDIMMVTNDRYMSRNHFRIDAKRSVDVMEYELTDHGATNATFINGCLLEMGSSRMLKDGDLVQAGLTKIIFKESGPETRTGAEAAQLVEMQPLGRTILLDLDKYEKN